MSVQNASTAVPSASRIQALRDKHARYEALIDEARQSRSTTDFYLRQLKKEKLQIKDLIQTSEEKQRASS